MQDLEQFRITSYNVCYTKLLRQTFDSELHEAIANMPAADKKDSGKVIDAVEKGYMLNDKVIRYAKVVVAQ